MKNTHIVTISLFAVSAAFILVSVLVTLSGGKNKYLIAKKLRLGAVIIGMTCMANGCRPVVTCYDPAPMPVLTCTDSVSNEGLIVLQKGDQTINFNCQFLYYQNVSYKIGNDIQDFYTGECTKTLADTTTQEEILSITTSGILNSGLYKLRLYYFQSAEIDENSTPFYISEIKVID
jgi:hypothetical protein